MHGAAEADPAVRLPGIVPDDGFALSGGDIRITGDPTIGTPAP